MSGTQFPKAYLTCFCLWVCLLPTHSYMYTYAHLHTFTHKYTHTHTTASCISVTIVPNSRPEDFFWFVYSSDNILLASGDVNGVECVKVNDTELTFKIIDTFGNGLCCTEEINGYYTVTWDGFNTSLNTIGDLLYYTIHTYIFVFVFGRWFLCKGAWK